MLADAGRSIVPAAGGDGRLVEGVDFGAAGGSECDMQAGRGPAGAGNPKERLARDTEARRIDSAAAPPLLGKLHLHADAERAQRRAIERFGGGEIRDAEANMVEAGHGVSSVLLPR